MRIFTYTRRQHEVMSAIGIQPAAEMIAHGWELTETSMAAMGLTRLTGAYLYHQTDYTHDGPALFWAAARAAVPLPPRGAVAIPAPRPLVFAPRDRMFAPRLRAPE